MELLVTLRQYYLSSILTKLLCMLTLFKSGFKCIPGWVLVSDLDPVVKTTSP